MADISVTELKARLDKGERPILIDVREEYERQAGNIGGLHLPMDVLPQRLDELAGHKTDEIIVYCRSGGRSGAAVAFLQQQAGFTNPRNLTGGMKAWKAEIDNGLTVA